MWLGGPLFRSKYWSFIDWSTMRNETTGVPAACRQGDQSITMESLLYLYGLQKAAELARFIDRDELAKAYCKRAEDLTDSIRRECMGSCADLGDEQTALIQDGPGIEEYSVHCQVFATLTGVVSPEEGKKMLKLTIGNEKYAQCSVTMQFYLFRALEITGCYEKTDELWNLWRRMVKWLHPKGWFQWNGTVMRTADVR